MASQFLFLFFLSLLFACSSGALFPSMKFEKEQMMTFHLSRKDLQKYIPAVKTIFKHDGLINDPSAPPVTNPVFNPVTTPVTNLPPPGNFVPGIVTIPATTPNPVSSPQSVPNPNPNPVNTPPVPGVTNPVTTPSTNPVTGSPPTPIGGIPVTPPAGTNSPAVPGQSWCVAKSGAPETSLQSALDYACGIGGADCSAIQQSGSCYNPNSLQNHASYAFNTYYQKNPAPTSCDFGGNAIITNTNPSSGSCVYPTSGSSSSSSSPSSSSPFTQIPTPSAPMTTPTTPGPTPTTSSSGTGTGTGMPVSGTPPTVLNTSNPTPGEMPSLGDGIPLGNSSTISKSTILQPFAGCIFLVASICMGHLF